MKKFITLAAILFSLSAIADTPAPPVITKLKPGTAVGAIVSAGGVITSVPAGTSGNVLTSNGTDWTSSPATGAVQSVNGQTGVVTITADQLLPDQTGNSGKALLTNGTTTSWQAVAGTGTVTNVQSTDSSIDITSPTTVPNLSLHFPMTAPGGSAGAPSYRFDADSGMYSPSDGVLRWSTNGVQALQIDNNQQITAANTITATDFIYPSKTAKTFLAAPNAGAGVPSFRLITQGDIVASALPFPMNAPGGSVTAPSYNFDADTGMWQPSDGIISFSNNGVLSLQIDNNGEMSGKSLTLTGNISAANYPPVDDANTPAYFDASGVLHNLPGWGVSPDHFGLYNNLSYGSPDGANTNFSDETYNIGMTEDAPTANVTGATETMNHDNAASAFDFGNVYMRRMELRLNGNGHVNYSSNLGLRHLIGNGSNTGELGDGNAFDNYMNVGAGFSILGTYNMSNNSSTIDGSVNNFYLNNNYVNGSGTAVNATGLGLAIQVPVTINLQLAALSNNQPVGSDYYGLGMYSDSTVGGNANLINMNQTQNVTGNLNFINSFIPNTVTIGSDYRALQMGNEAAVGNNAAGAIFTQNGTVAKAYTGVGAYLNADVGDGTSFVPMFDANVQNHTIAGSLTAFNFSNSSNVTGNNNIQGGNWNNSGTGYRFTGLGIYNNANMTEEMKGVDINLQGNARTGSGLGVFMSGAYTDDVRGLKVDVGNVTSSSTTNHVMAAEIQGGNVSINGVSKPFSNAQVDVGNYFSSTLEVPNGSPVVGTDFIQQIIQSNLILHDTISPGPFGLGINSTAMVPQIALDSGIIVPYYRTLLIGTSVPQGSGGNITDGVVAELLGFPSFGGSLSVDNLTGLQDAQALGQQFCDYATNCWFMRVRDTRAETFLPKLAIGTATQKVASNVGLEVNDAHLRFTGTNVTANVDANAGSGAVCTVTGNDVAGIIDIEEGGSGWAAGAQCQIVFTKTHNTNPVCSFSPKNAAAGAAPSSVQPWMDTSTTDAVMFFVNADTGPNEYRWAYHCEEAF